MQVPETPRATRWAVHALVVAAMVGGVVAFVGFDKTVHLSVDGRTEQVRTYAHSVGGVLAREGITVGPHDSVVPALDRGISDGQRIAVRFGRPIELDHDGKSRRVWVTATNVGEALRELGLRDRNAFVSASRSEPIGREGLALRVLSARQITVKVDIPFRTRRILDPKMSRWQQKVIVPGRTGVKELTVALTRRDGKSGGRETIASRVLRKPVTRVVRVGRGLAGHTRTGVERLNWAALASCESQGKPGAINRVGHYGLFQFSVATWRSVGGRGMPHRATRAEQTYRAQLLYKRHGARPWPNCGRALFRR